MSFAGKNLFVGFTDGIQITPSTPTLVYTVPPGTQTKVSAYVYMAMPGSVTGTSLRFVPVGKTFSDPATFVFNPPFMVGPSRFNVIDVPMAAGDEVWIQSNDSTGLQFFRVDGVEFT